MITIWIIVILHPSKAWTTSWSSLGIPQSTVWRESLFMFLFFQRCCYFVIVLLLLFTFYRSYIAIFITYIGL